MGAGGAAGAGIPLSDGGLTKDAAPAGPFPWEWFCRCRFHGLTYMFMYIIMDMTCSISSFYVRLTYCMGCNHGIGGTQGPLCPGFGERREMYENRGGAADL